MGLYLPFFKDENELSFFMLSLLYLIKTKMSIEKLEKRTKIFLIKNNRIKTLQYSENYNYVCRNDRI